MMNVAKQVCIFNIVHYWARCSPKICCIPSSTRALAETAISESYDKLGLEFQTYDEWIASGARIPATAAIGH